MRNSPADAWHTCRRALRSAVSRVACTAAVGRSRRRAGTPIPTKSTLLTAAISHCQRSEWSSGLQCRQYCPHYIQPALPCSPVQFSLAQCAIDCGKANPTGPIGNYRSVPQARQWLFNVGTHCVQRSAAQRSCTNKQTNLCIARWLPPADLAEEEEELQRLHCSLAQADARRVNVRSDSSQPARHSHR